MQLWRCKNWEDSAEFMAYVWCWIGWGSLNASIFYSFFLGLLLMLNWLGSAECIIFFYSFCLKNFAPIHPHTYFLTSISILYFKLIRALDFFESTNWIITFWTFVCIINVDQKITVKLSFHSFSQKLQCYSDLKLNH